MTTTAPPRQLLLLLAIAGAVVLAQALVPLNQFIHRGDDAYYYFQVALRYPVTGFWSFDAIHPTNGVQPLWAILLTAVAQLLHWVGVTDPQTVARVFVAVTALFHVASCYLLLRLLSQFVSPGTGVAAAAAFLLPMGIVWARVWGMENSLYAFLLLSTVTYFHTVFLERPAIRRAIALGALLGLTALARLNAGVFIPCLLLYWLFFRRADGTLAWRFRTGVVVGAAASALIIPYLVWNFTNTGHLLPISGEVKSILTARALEANDIPSRFSVAFLKYVYWTYFPAIESFITSRAGDGLAIVGGRIALSGDARVPVPLLAGVLAAFLALPMLLGGPRAWLGFLRERMSHLSQFAYIAVFGVLNAATSVLLYPAQLAYAMTRWWLVENELVIVVIVCTIVMAAVGYVAARAPGLRMNGRFAVAAMALIVLYHVQQSVRHYWSDATVFYDWNTSWNDESYKAARWLAANVDSAARVGSWNAGVLGYYAVQRVTNLDGLINSAELLPYLRDQRIADYVTREGIEYLSDMESMVAVTHVDRALKLTVVYESHSPLMNQRYRVYRVER